MNLGKVWHCSHWGKNNPASLVASSAGALRRNGSLGNTHASSMHQAMSQTQSQTLRSRRSPALAHLGCAHTWNGNVLWALETRMQDCSNPRHVLFLGAWCCIKASYMFAFNHSYLMLRIWNCTLDHCTPRRMHDKEHIQTWQRKLSPATTAQLTK